MQCPHCGRDSDPLFKFCLHCGKELGGAKKKKKKKQPAPEAAPVAKPADAAPQESTAEGPAEPTPPPAGADEEQDGHVRCARCRAKVKAGTEVCPLCGFNFSQGQPTPERKEDSGTTTTAHEDAVGYLISVSSVDGRETVKLPLKRGRNSLGREECDIRFAEDDLLSPEHLELVIDGDTATLKDLSSRNGTFLRMTDQARLEHGDLFRIGQQLLRFEELAEVEPVVTNNEPDTQVLGSPAGPKAWGRLTQVVSEEQSGSSFLLANENVFLGRERGNITFPGDRYISGTHAVITRKADGSYLRDVGSSNGTYVRLKGELATRSGQYFLAGRQLFKLYLGS